MKNFLIILISTLLFYSCKKEKSGNFTLNSKIDSLINQANKSTDYSLKLRNANTVLYELKQNELDSVTRKNYVELTRIYFSLNNLKYVEICKLLISKPSKKINHYENSFYNYLLGNYYYSISNYEKSYFHLSKAEKSFVILKNKSYLGYTLHTKADILTFKKDFISAEILSVKTLKIAKNLKNYELIYSCYLTLGNSLNGLNNFEKAKEYYDKAVICCENLKSNPNYISFNVMPRIYLSQIYQKQKKYNNAIQSAQKGLNFIKDKNKEILLYCYLTNNLAYSKFKLGDKSSLNQFQETLKIGDSIKSIPIIITSKTYLGEYYLTEKDTLKANFYLKDAQLLAHKNNIYEDELKILQLLAQANPVKESFYNNRYIQLNDSLQNVERSTRDKFARIEFETAEITEENKIIIKKNTTLNYILWLLFGISLLSILLIYMQYRNNIQKAKNRELILIQEQQNAEIRELNLLQEQKKAEAEIFQLIITQQNKFEEGKNSEKQRISLELHDDVMGNLSGTRTVLWGELKKIGLANKETFKNLIDKILEVEISVREIAHNLNTNIFNNNASFEEVVKELFNKIKGYSVINFELIIDPNVNFKFIDNTIKINLYRIIQEALHNIDKYAQAKTVKIDIKQNHNLLTIKIVDDGKGFDYTTTSDGIGIKNMRTRMGFINGTITIDSKLKHGTKINLKVPI